MIRTPQVSVGIMLDDKINFILHTPYTIYNNEIEGKQTVSYVDGQLEWNNILYDELLLIPIDADMGYFELIDVTIGIDFHWERKENQQFRGCLRLIPEKGKVRAINILPIEEYLVSVISSEMSATASLELLKAHAVISRSWLIAQIKKNKQIIDSGVAYSSTETTSEDEHIVWYDREDHTDFDVCADDHCQRYQGITKASTPIVEQAVQDTDGLILIYNNKICDTRFSKCCGGVFEEFASCWGNEPHPYLKRHLDSMNGTLPDLKLEANSVKWISTSPDAFCNTTDKKILGQVLNNYDQETTNFYRWKEILTQEEISKLITEKSKIEFGNILDLVPIKRGPSGRLIKLKIVGSKKTLIIGKELEIRRVLSKSHLYSSAFIVEKGEVENNIPKSFTLTGAGWGHGVGLCQIGAAVMGEQGYDYEQILKHYYIGASLQKNY